MKSVDLLRMFQKLSKPEQNKVIEGFEEAEKIRRQKILMEIASLD